MRLYYTFQLIFLHNCAERHRKILSCYPWTWWDCSMPSEGHLHSRSLTGLGLRFCHLQNTSTIAGDGILAIFEWSKPRIKTKKSHQIVTINIAFHRPGDSSAQENGVEGGNVQIWATCRLWEVQIGKGVFCMGDSSIPAASQSAGPSPKFSHRSECIISGTEGSHLPLPELSLPERGAAELNSQNNLVTAPGLTGPPAISLYLSNFILAEESEGWRRLFWEGEDK